jgi:hypothetical protein
MRRLTALLLGTAILAGTALVAAPTANAVGGDGKLYAYSDTNWRNVCGGWTNNSTSWGQCGTQVSSVWNNGFLQTYDKVRMYWGVRYTGTSYCLAQGTALSDLRDKRFNIAGTNVGAVMDNHVFSHQWVPSTSCYS